MGKRGRPPLGNEKLIQTTVNLKLSQKSWLDKNFKETGKEQAKVIREAIDEHIERVNLK